MNIYNGIIAIMSISIFCFNIFYYNQKKMDKLLCEYQNLTEAQKKETRFISILISIITLIGFVLAIYYLNYLHSQNIKS
jgi:hypothetical protein